MSRVDLCNKRGVEFSTLQQAISPPDNDMETPQAQLRDSQEPRWEQFPEENQIKFQMMQTT